MTRAERCDVLVIGLGPAGASAAAAAANAGLQVIAVDRKKAAGIPVQCAEFIPGPLYGHVAGLERSMQQPIGAMNTMVETSPPFHSPDFRGAMIDRAQFDAMLVARASEAGADTRFGLRIKAVKQDGVHLLDGSILDADIIIGADGPRSVVGRAIGSVNKEFVETRQVTVPLLQGYRATDIYLSADYKGGYAWLFPRGVRANLGLGMVPSQRHRLKGLLEELKTQLVQEGRIGSEVLSLTGGSIPIGGPVASTGKAHGRAVLLAGDAAGLTNPVTGAGIASAVQSGRMAGEAASAYHDGDCDALEDFQDELIEIFGPSLERAVMRRKEMIKAFANGQRPDERALRQGWIAFPEYWSNTTVQQAPYNERLYA